MTQPDIAFVVNKVCQYMHKPTEAHLLLVKRILRYLHNTSTFGILLRPVQSLDLTFSAYTDVDWAGDHLDRRSTSGYCVYLGSTIILWSSHKQHIVSLSSTEAEYRGLVVDAAELMWVESLLRELKVTLNVLPLYGVII